MQVFNEIRSKTVFFSVNNSPWFWFSSTIISVISCVFIYFLKDYQNHLIKEKILLQAQRQINQKENIILKNLTEPLVWTMRKYLLSGDTLQMGIFANNLIRLKNISNVNIVNNNAKIIVSSNTANVATSALAFYAPPLLIQDSTITIMKTDKVWVVAAPIMSKNKRLATLLFDYSPNLNDLL